MPELLTVPGAHGGNGNSLNSFLAALSRHCRDNLILEKWIVAPSLRVGHQWLDTIALAGQPVVNARIKTLKGLALELAGPEMARSGVSLISSTGSLVLVDRLLDGLRSAPSAYLASLPPGQGLSKTVLSSITALRLANLGPDELERSSFEEPAKARDLQYLLNGWLEALQRDRLMDYAAILEIAAARLAAEGSLSPNKVLVLIPEESDLTALERRLVDALPAGMLVWLPVDRPRMDETVATPIETDSGLLQWLPAPSRAPQPFQDGSAKIFRAVGEANEVREVLRRCLAEGYPLDQVELLHTDAATYVPLVYETFVRLRQDGGSSAFDLPVTFAEGIPARYARPGRALAAWMEWIREGYPQDLLERMIRDGLLHIPDTQRSLWPQAKENHPQITQINADGRLKARMISSPSALDLRPSADGLPENLRGTTRNREIVVQEDRFSFADLAAVFRTMPIAAGRERYENILAGRTAGLPEEGEASDEAAGESSCGPDLEGLRPIQDLLRGLLAVTPDPQATGQTLLQAARVFVADLARSHSELDNYARQALVDHIDDLARWLEDGRTMPGLDLWDWLAALPAEARVGGSGPRPGCLHVAGIESGGYSGRRYTFIVGLDDRRFPGAGLNDPLLLDSERRNVSADLPTAAQQLVRRTERFALLLARLRGTVTLSFPAFDLKDDRELFPSPVIVSAFRILSGNHDGDQADLMRWLPVPASFAGDTEDGCLDETEWWLWRLCGTEKVQNPQQVVSELFPHLARGHTAIESRASADFTVYDGRIVDPPADLDPTSSSARAMSSSALETIGACPLRYFFKYVLDVQPPKELRRDAGQWLNAGEFGELLHEVFYEFMNELIRQRRAPLFDRDLPRLISILDGRVENYRKRFPPPSESALRRQRTELLRAAHIFLKEEEVLSRTNRPLFLEVSVGRGSRNLKSDLDRAGAVAIEVAPHRAVKVTGRLDRVDRLIGGSDSDFAICDYKTGSDSKYRKPDPFWNGRILQHAIYMELAEALLRGKIARKPRVVHFDYFLTSLRGRGHRVRIRPEQLAAARSIVDNLCRIVGEGCFLATNDAKTDCKYCDYRTICVDVEATAQAAAQKLANSENQCLEPMRMLRNVEND
ncbi:MAG: PD-(D/E)XK nuclease family protein [Desulfomonile tiedjei]|nr:PD-(D/E)XK nuclease family protein [Desulfomonile tiedjei]